ncbi:hypothetical protein B0H14DRAFT_3489903 [Mycena olivaceomarginata]|nr:hypothetical protein B0H14DRAFT_3489903 [Mycena olivaceomarginata]
MALIANSLRVDHELATAYIPDGKLSLFVGMSVFKKLKTQNCSKDLKLTWFQGVNLYVILHYDKPKKRKKAPNQPELAAVRKAARLEATRKHRWENEEPLREKARAIKASGCVSEEQAERTKKAHATYRAKHQAHLAFKQRLRRQEAFIAKHGIEAYRERIAAETARANAVLRAEQVARDLERLRQTRPAAT